MYFDIRALRREKEGNTEPFFIRGDRLTVSSTHAASIKLPVVSTHLSGKYLLNPEHCAEEPKHNVWRCGCVRHIMRFSQSMHSCAPKRFQAGLEATTEHRRLSPNKLQKLLKTMKESSVCAPTTAHPVCVLSLRPVAAAHNKNRCLIDSLISPMVSRVIYVWSKLAEHHFLRLPVTSFCQTLKKKKKKRLRLLPFRKGWTFKDVAAVWRSGNAAGRMLGVINVHLQPCMKWFRGSDAVKVPGLFMSVHWGPAGAAWCALRLY